MIHHFPQDPKTGPDTVVSPLLMEYISKHMDSPYVSS